SASHLVSAYAEAAKKLGVEIYENETFEAGAVQSPRQNFIETNLSKFVADKYIFTAGSWTGRLLKNLAPVDPVKGQILIYDTPPGWSQSKHWVTPLYCGPTPSGFP